MIRRVLAAALAVIGIVTSATPAAALLLWTLTAAPLTVTAGVTTSFSLTATNLDLLTELGCLEVDLPASFDIASASAGNASNGDEWEAIVFPNKVAVHSLSGGGRLELGQSITFTITALPGEAGAFTWSNHAHRQQDCSGSEEIGVPLAVAVLPALIPTPTPTPLPTPTPRPTPTPTPILPIEPLPTLPPIVPLPSLPALPTLRPATPIPTVAPSTEASPTLSPSATPSPTPVEGVTAALPAGAGGAPSGSGLGSSGLAPVALGLVEPEGADGSVGEVSLGPLAIDGIGVWAIPGAIIGGPGLLVILWVILQTGVALAWIPAVRRMRGRDGGGPSWPRGRAAA